MAATSPILLTGRKKHGSWPTQFQRGTCPRPALCQGSSKIPSKDSIRSVRTLPRRRSLNRYGFSSADRSLQAGQEKSSAMTWQACSAPKQPLQRSCRSVDRMYPVWHAGHGRMTPVDVIFSSFFSLLFFSLGVFLAS